MVFLPAKAVIFQPRTAAGHFGRLRRSSHSLRISCRFLLSDGTWYVFESIIMLFGYSCKSGWLETIRSMVWRRSNGSHQWSEALQISIDSDDQESVQLCSRQAEGRAMMELF